MDEDIPVGVVVVDFAAVAEPEEIPVCTVGAVK